jgi:hypothetical protein
MALLTSGFPKVANNQRYWNQWLVADVWATLINQELQLPEEIKLTGAYSTQSLKYKSIKNVGDIYHTPNDYSLFRSKIAKVTAFYVTTTTTSCPKLNNYMPGGSTQFIRELVATIQTRTTAITTNITTNLPSTTV